MEQNNSKQEKWDEISKDGVAFKKERKGKMTTMLSAFIFIIVFEIVILFISIFDKSLEEIKFVFIIAIPVVFICQIIFIPFILKPFMKILKMDDYQAGLEYNRLEEERQRELKKRDERNR